MTCLFCNGTGDIVVPRMVDGKMIFVPDTCPACDGSGKEPEPEHVEDDDEYRDGEHRTDTGFVQ